jgi:hypothetical protein
MAWHIVGCLLVLAVLADVEGTSPQLRMLLNNTLKIDNNDLPIMVNAIDLDAFIQQTDSHIAALEAIVSNQASTLEELSSVVDIYTPFLIGPGISQVTRLSASDAASQDRFGYAVAIADVGALAIMAVGAPGQEETGAGKAYLLHANFAVEPPVFSTPKLFRPAGLSSNHNYGAAIAIAPDGQTVAVGAPTADKVGFLQSSIRDTTPGIAEDCMLSENNLVVL